MARITGVEGLAELQSALRGLMPKVAQAIDAGNRRLANDAAARMRATAPKKPGVSGKASGHLASTIRVQRRSAFQTDVIVGDESTYYLGFYEFGADAGNQPARPFVRPAAGQAESDFGNIMRGEAQRRIR